MTSIDLDRLISGVSKYGAAAGASQSTIEAMREMLRTPLIARILSLSDDELHSVLMNDAYKIKMHQMYAKYFTGVTADFALNMRRTPLPLATLQRDHPQVWAALQHHVRLMERCQPLSPAVLQALRVHYDFTPSQAMLQRAQQHGVAPVTWQDTDGLLAFASGPVEAASHVETSMMQLVQHATIRAQAQALSRGAASGAEHSIEPAAGTAAAALADSPGTATVLDDTELLANALGRLCSVVERINAGLPRTTSIMLFAGRRASSRPYLLLQNLFCMRHLASYGGTSSVAAVALLEAAMLEEGWPEARRRQLVGGLKGTHAHELSMLSQQLLAGWDVRAGQACGAPGPVCISSVLSHLLFLAANGGLASATALADTFTTRAFVKVALAARVPPAFIEDMAQLHGSAVEPGARVFDIIRIWRLDSGDYHEVAELVVAAWEQRCREAQEQGGAGPARPVLMNSNLESVEEVIAAGALPERIRPAVLGFGTLADGFVPFDLGPGRGSGEIKMCSVVMKAVQGRADKMGPPSQACAGKLGDDRSLAKVQLDPRLPGEVQAQVRAQLVAMAEASAGEELECEVLSAVLQEAYCAVTREGLLM